MARTPFPLVSVPLSGIAMRYSGINRDARGYIADLVAPRYRVRSQLFRWFQSRISEAFTVADTQIDRLGQANEITQNWDDQTASTIDHALREPVPYADEMEAQNQLIPFSLRQEAAENVTDKVQLRREIRVAALTMTSASYLASYVIDLTSGTKWSDFANSDPVAQIIDLMQSMLIRPTVMITSQRVANVLRRHPKVAVALGGTQNSGMYYPLDQVAALLGLRRIIVGDTIKQTSVPGQTLATGNIWPDSVALHFQAVDGAGNVSSIKTPNFLTTFQWNDWVASEKEFEPGDMGLYGGVKVLVGESVIEKQVAPYAGALILNVL